MEKEREIKTVVISAFPGCGKSYAFNNYKDMYLMTDSDSSQFSWIKDADGNNTAERDPNFPENYINHIKNNIGKVDFIFVSSHENVRVAMIDAGIEFAMVLPKIELLDEWVGRFYRRGNDVKFIDFMISRWHSFITEIDYRHNTCGKKYYLGSCKYIDLPLLNAIHLDMMAELE